MCSGPIPLRPLGVGEELPEDGDPTALGGGEAGGHPCQGKGKADARREK